MPSIVFVHGFGSWNRVLSLQLHERALHDTAEIWGKGALSNPPVCSNQLDFVV